MKSHEFHQPPDSLSPDGVSLPSQPRRHLTGAEKRRLHVLPVDERHEFQVFVALDPRLHPRTNVEARPVESEKFALPPDAEDGMIPLYQPSFFFKREAGIFFIQSSSIFSRPIS
jgi:hypothetical protein